MTQTGRDRTHTSFKTVIYALLFAMWIRQKC